MTKKAQLWKDDKAYRNDQLDPVLICCRTYSELLAFIILHSNIQIQSVLVLALKTSNQ